MIWQTRDLARLQEITSVLIRYGFSALVKRWGLAHILEKAGRVLKWDEVDELVNLETPIRIRRTLEELGPTFIKLGQMLALRMDLFDAEWIHEFSKLQDNAPPVHYAEIRDQLVDDLRGAPEEVFVFFDPEPIAAGSIAQIHKAILQSGSEVVVKVRRPGISSKIESDLRWLRWLVQLLLNENSDWRYLHPEKMVEQFAYYMRRELDLAGECRNAERIAANFSGYLDTDTPNHAQNDSPIIVIPKIYWEWTGERIAVIEYINGIPGRNLEAALALGYDRKLLARRGAKAILKMVVKDGLFHADPHLGNIFFLPENRLAFIDFGMVGRLTEERRDQLIRLLFGIFNNQPHLVTEVMLDWTTSTESIDEDILNQNIQIFIDQYQGAALKDIKIGTLLLDFTRLVRQHRLALPPDLVLLIKVFVTLDGLGKILDPTFDIAMEIMPMLQQAIESRYAAWNMTKRGWNSANEALSLLGVLPSDMIRLLRRMRRGNFEIRINVSHLSRVGNQFDNAVRRLTLGLIVSALIIGSSIIATVSGGPALATIGVLGYIAAGWGGLRIILSKSDKFDH